MTTINVRGADQTDIQLIRMQQQVREIAKEEQKEVIGVEQTPNEEWVIVSKKEHGRTLQLMVNDCHSPYDGHWDFALQAEYVNAHRLFIDDIKGDPNRGFGSICMAYLKDAAWQHNCLIEGKLAKRDWDHLDRLIHFYKKHHFHVSVNEEAQSGHVIWHG